MALLDSVKARLDRRRESLKNFWKKDVDTMASGKALNTVKTGADDLRNLRPVAAVADVVAGAVETVASIPVGLIRNTADFVKEQGQIAREGVQSA